MIFTHRLASGDIPRTVPRRAERRLSVPLAGALIAGLSVALWAVIILGGVVVVQWLVAI